MADRHITEKLLEGERLSGKVTLFAKVTILPGDELPYHEHHGETETYHILSGGGMYQDNDKTYPVQAGMTTFCEDSSGHAISCLGEEPLVFLAMIQKKAEIPLTFVVLMLFVPLSDSSLKRFPLQIIRRCLIYIIIQPVCI